MANAKTTTSSPFINLGSKVKVRTKDGEFYGVVEQVIKPSLVIVNGQESKVKDCRSVGNHPVECMAGAFNNHNPMPRAIEEANYIGKGAKITKDLKHGSIHVFPPHCKVYEGHEILHEVK